MENIKGILPPIVIRKNTYYETIDENSTLVLVLSYILTNRKKKGVFGRESEILKSAYLIYYPIYLQEITHTKAYVIDFYSVEELKLTYKEPFLDLIINLVNKLNELKREQFLHHLNRIIEILHDMIIKEKYFIKSRIVIKNIVMDEAFLNDINFLLNYSFDKWLEGYVVTISKSYIEDVIITNTVQIEKLLKSSYNIMNSINQLIPLLDHYYIKWKKDLEMHINGIISEKRRQLGIIRRKVDLRIHELQKRLAKEIENVEISYRPLVESLSKQMNDITMRISKTKEDIQGSKQKKLARQLRRHIKTMEKQRESLSKRLRILMRRIEEEKKRINYEYKKLVELELKKVDVLEKEIDDLTSHKDELVDIVLTSIQRIKNYLIQLNDIVSRTQSILYRYSINTPLKGSGIYLIPYIVVNYRSKKGLREYIVPPLCIDIYGFSRPKFFDYNSIYLYLKRSTDKILNKYKLYKSKRYDLLTKINPDIIIDRTKYLLDHKIIDENMYKEIIEFMKNFRK